MNGDIMGTVLERLDRRMNFVNRKVILFLDNATCHPKSLHNGITNIIIVFLPKNSTSQLQPLDAGIIRNFKFKYRKLFLRFVFSRVNDSQSASQIEEVHILQDIMATNNLEKCYSVNHQKLFSEVWF